MPFVINPSAKLHQYFGASTSLNVGGCSPQFFSYRNRTMDFGSGNAHLQFYPSSMDRIRIDDDISLKLIYAHNSNLYVGNSLTLADIVNSMPGVSIREFLPDTRLDQCINMFTGLIANMTKVFTEDKKKETTNSSDGKTKTQ